MKLYQYTLIQYTLIASALALLTVAEPSEAAKRCQNAQNCATTEQPSKMQRRTRRPSAETQSQQRIKRRQHVNDQEQSARKLKRKHVQADDDRKRHHGWRFDPRKHRRSHNRTTVYRFYYGGYWYPAPYWTGQVYVVTPGYGISCNQGRNIVSRRYNRVRIVECSGSVFTYLGHRYGDTFRVSVSSTSGQILRARPI